ncbi:unnamed protein product, partial [marine sediment metagenome]
LRAGGDARFAIGMLRVAAQRAESQDLERIPNSLLDETLAGARLPARAGKLNPQQKVIVDMLKEKSMGAALLYQEFLKAGKAGGMKPVVDRMFRRHLESLVKKGMIKSSGYGRWKVYTVT